MARAGARTALGALALAVVLAGCRTAPPAKIIGPGADAPWPEQRAALENFDAWSLTGRVAVAAGGEGFSGSLRYQQQPHRSDLSLDGPMGIGGVRVALDGEEISIATSGGDHLDGAAARAELERRLGFALPLAEMRWWLLGIPAPGDADLIQDGATGEVEGFVQSGWKVVVNARAAALGFALPQRLTVEREGARMKLLVEQWRP